MQIFTSKLKAGVFSGLFFAGFFLQASAQVVFPHDTRSDSIDITHYDIYLNATDFSGYTLKGRTDVHFKPLVNGISKIDLDLIGLGIDSVKLTGGGSLAFSPLALGYRISLGATYNMADSATVQVYYHGTPVSDATFGGYYFNANFSYNVGVSLDDIPHNYGKTWFPCFDNFTERSTFDLHITTPGTHAAACGGSLQGITPNPDLTKTYHWKIKQTIPSYLVSSAVARYEFVKGGFTNLDNDTVPVWLAARATDTTNMKNAFVNLEAAFDIYEQHYGPYHWDRVGYVLVPMTAGAMEHAMNIAYPIALANGSTAYESVMAHELSHHWWGDLVTCRTAEDMWINEGMAVYSEYLFTENLYGRNQYNASVRNEHKELLRSCHVQDGGYWPLSGVPQAHTYGYTTYSKGADMVHSMRAYLGDSLFFTGLQAFLDQNKFSDVGAIEFRDELGTITGMNMDDYFATWIFQGGWPHVSIDSVKYAPAGIYYDVTVYLKQKLVGRTDYGDNIPITLTLRDQDWHTFEATVLSSGSNNTVTVTVPFIPTSACLNRDEKISHAVTGAYQVIKTTGTVSMMHANMSLGVQSITDSVYMIVEHHWAAPDPVTDWTKGFTISPQRFWRVDGIWKPGFTTNATIAYNGKTSGTNSHLDHLLITGTEDSLILLYRPDRAADWTEFPTYTKNMGSPTDKSGSITITNMQKGEYTLALKGQTIGLNETGEQKIKVYPNPASGLLNIESEDVFEYIVITDMHGTTVEQKWVSGKLIQVDSTGWAPGAYILSGFSKNKKVFRKKVMIK